MNTTLAFSTNTANPFLFAETMQQLIARHSAKLKNLAMFLTHDSNEADDLYQDTIYKILMNEHRFDKSTNFNAWSSTIMRNTFINRHRGMRKATFNVDSSDMQAGIYDDRKVYNDGESNIQYSFLENVVNGLEQQKSSIFKMYTDGYSYEEISEKTGHAVNRLRSIVFTTRKELQMKLKSMNFDYSAS